MARRISLDEQEVNVRQLLADRKDGIGGYAEGFKDFAEMGPPQGGQWPLSAESIRRAFGVPEDRQDEESRYYLTARAKSHVVLEHAIETYLKPHAPAQYRAINTISPLDGDGGNRDYKWFTEKAKAGRGDYRWYVVAYDMAVTLLALHLQDHDLIVDFARRRSRIAEQEMEKRNAAIVAEYHDEVERGGKRSGEAARIVANTHGISERRLYELIEGWRLEQGMEKRRPGRPRKSA